MEGNYSFERYESLRDNQDGAKAVQLALPSGTATYEVQKKWASALQEATYGDKGSAKANVEWDGVNAGDYRKEHGWSFHEFDSYTLLGKDDLSQELDSELPRSGDKHDRGSFDSFRIPTVAGEPLPVRVTTDSDLERAKEMLENFMAQEDMEGATGGPTGGNTQETDSPFGDIDGIGAAKAGKLESDPRVMWVGGESAREELSDEQEQLVDAYTDGSEADFGDVVTVETTTSVEVMDESEMLESLSNDDRRMAETLIEAGEDTREVLKRFL